MISNKSSLRQDRCTGLPEQVWMRVLLNSYSFIMYRNSLELNCKNTFTSSQNIVDGKIYYKTIYIKNCLQMFPFNQTITEMNNIEEQVNKINI